MNQSTIVNDSPCTLTSYSLECRPLLEFSVVSFDPPGWTRLLNPPWILFGKSFLRIVFHFSTFFRRLAWNQRYEWKGWERNSPFPQILGCEVVVDHFHFIIVITIIPSPARAQLPLSSWSCFFLCLALENMAWIVRHALMRVNWTVANAGDILFYVVNGLLVDFVASITLTISC